MLNKSINDNHLYGVIEPKVFYIIILLILVVSGCSQFSSAPEKFFETSKSMIYLSKEFKGDWQHVCFISPYSYNKYAEEILGFKFDVETKTSILSSEGITLLVLVKTKRLLITLRYLEVI